MSAWEPSFRSRAWNYLDRNVKAPKECDEKWESEFRKATGGLPKMNLLQFMQSTACRSRFFAVKLFDALDYDRTGLIDFNDYRSFLYLLAVGDSAELGGFAFELFDADGDGQISKDDLRLGLEASIVESESSINDAEKDKLTNVLVKLFVDEGSETVTRERFISVLKSYPDVLGNFTVGNVARAAALRDSTCKVSRRRTWLNAQRMWFDEHPQRAFSILLTVAVISSCFFWRFWRYTGDCSGVDLDFMDPNLNVSRSQVMHMEERMFGVRMSVSDAQYMAFSTDMKKHDPIRCQDARKRKLLSWTLPIAKGCGQGMKATFTLILIPVSRTLMTQLRKTFLKHVFDFDNAIAYHRLLGKLGFALAWIHTLMHIVDVIRWQDPDLFKQWSFAFPVEKHDVFDMDSMTNETATYRGMPMELLRDPDEQPSTKTLLTSWFGLTGIVLITTYTIAALFAFDYPRKLRFFVAAPGEKETSMSPSRRAAVRIGQVLNDFNYFWYSHHLFVLFYLALLFHPFPHIPDERNEWAWSDSWLWVLIPVLIYSLERLHRSMQKSTQTPVTDLRLLPGRVLELKVKKPEKLKYKAGQYVFINCAQISKFEWHPFTLTSAPHETDLSVHIRAAGDWTNELHKTVRRMKYPLPSRDSGEEDNSRQLDILVAGPYGAPAQNYNAYGVVVCVGAGIGVTPFASILNSVLNGSPSSRKRKLEKIYFHWTVRTREEASWFKTLMDEIADKDTEGRLDVNIHITSLKGGNDLRVMLLRMAEFENIDVEQGHVVGKSVIHFGRPNWSRILRLVQCDHSAHSRVGVFYCGPPGLKNDLKNECRRRSAIVAPKFVFHKEVF